MISIPELLAEAAALVIIVRLLTFRRRGGRHRQGVALVAWLVACANVALIIKLPELVLPTPVTVLLALFLITFAILLLHTGGNLAHLLRTFLPYRRH